MNKSILFVLSGLCLASCSSKEEVLVNDYGYKSRIAMQRVKDTDPLAKQDLVSREAVQYAMLEKMNEREERLQREFKRVQEKQQKAFLQTQQENIDTFNQVAEKTTTQFDKISQDNLTNFQQVSTKTSETLDNIGQIVAENQALNTQTYNAIDEAVNTMVQDHQVQNKAFIEMREAYQQRLSYDLAKDEREKERENTIRGVVENMYDEQDAALKTFFESLENGMLPPSEWTSLEDAEITIHVENQTLEGLILRALNHASVQSGPWQLKWKLKRENQDLLYTKFSLDAESSFGEFIDYVKGYIVNYNGVVLHFRIFKEKRILMVSDT